MRKPAALLAILILATASGCVKRTLSITSDPPGAQVIINGQPAGETPVELAFRHHGTYRVEVRRRGYLPITDRLRLGRKLYELAGPDFIAEVLWPGTIHDRRAAHYELKRTPPLDKGKLLERARRAAAEAEKLIPELVAAPPPRPGARDRPLLPGIRKPPKKKAPSPAPGLPEPPGEPETEEGREK